MSTAKDVLNSLQAVNGEVALAIQIGTILFPIAKGAITEIRSISTGVETVKYAVLVETDEAEVDVTDPSGVITVTPGSADQSTPTNFKPNGTAAVGTVTAKVTDTSNGLVGSGSFDVVAPAPPPPPGPDTLVVGFVPA
jgi:hypothetical protein